METNALSGPNKIFVPAGKYALTIAGAAEDAAATGDLDITDDLTIGGAGAPSTIVDGSTLDRVFHILPGVTAEIASVTISGGSLGVVFAGGGILNEGILTLDWSTVAGNSVSIGAGGGILNTGTLAVSLSTISGNVAGIAGGGIINAPGSTVSISNSTISGNSATDDGGGIYNDALGTVSLNNVTITGNAADFDNDDSGAGGGVYNAAGGTVLSKNTIIAGNRIASTFVGPVFSRDCWGVFTSQGHNLVGNSTDCTWVIYPGDLIGTSISPINPLLGPLADNDGLTQTHQIPSTSPAADAGGIGLVGGTCEAIDQRAIVRPKDADHDGNARCDIGAYELDGLVECAIIPNLPIPAGAGCSRYDMEGTLVITTNAFDPLFRSAALTLINATCQVEAHLTTTHSAVITLLGDVDKVDVEITSLSGYTFCPGPMSLGSSIPSTGTIIENVSLIPGELEFPATAIFDLCVAIYTTTTLGTLQNCPDNFTNINDKSPLRLECIIGSLVSYTCTLPASQGPYNFFDASKTSVAFVSEGDLTLNVSVSVGGVAELPEVAGVPLQETDSDAGVGLFTALLAALTVTVALGGAAWYARGRRSR